MKRIVLLVTMLLLFALCADFAVAQAPLRPQDGSAATCVGSLKWAYYGWAGIDTLAGPDDSTLTSPIYTGNALWNRWSMRVRIDSIGTDPDSVTMFWRYKLNGDTAWSARIGIHKILANGYPVSGSISKSIDLSGLAEKPEYVQLWARLRDAAGNDKAITKKIELVTQ